jgi:hypothetical protein
MRPGSSESFIGIISPLPETPGKVNVSWEDEEAITENRFACRIRM